jgi:predicted Zn-dependent protease
MSERPNDPEPLPEDRRGRVIDREALLNAMVSELERSRDGLDVPDGPDAYYLAYRLRRTESLRLRAAHGSLVRDRHSDRARIHVSVRVGDSAFDNIADGGLEDDATDRESADWLQAPDDLDPEALRVAYWKLTEVKLDEAIEDYFDHQKARVTEFLRDEVDSFGPRDPAHPREVMETLGDDPFPRRRWGDLLRRLSRRFLDEPDVYDPGLDLRVHRLQRFFVDTDGARSVTEDVYLELTIEGWVLTDDGVYVEATRIAYGRSLDAMPDAETIEGLIDEVLEDLDELAGAESPGSYIGPALLSGQAAATMFHEALGHRLEGNRLVARGETRTFAHMRGERVLPIPLDVYDDPTLREVGGQPLWGSYRVDDEGIPAQRAQLIRAGRLVGFLRSRAPVPGNERARSNGHGRHDGVQGVMARMGNLVIEAGDQISERFDRETLERRLLELAREQGRDHALIIERVRAGETSTTSYDFQAFKGELAEVYLVDVRDGTRRRVRDVELIGTPLSVMQRIVAAGKNSGIDHGFCHAESGSVPVGGVAPELLLTEVELQQKSTSGYHEPLLPPPFADDGSRGREQAGRDRGRRKGRTSD